MTHRFQNKFTAHKAREAKNFEVMFAIHAKIQKKKMINSVNLFKTEIFNDFNYSNKNKIEGNL